MVWLTGAIVRRTGVYSVTHRAHRPTHQVVIQQGEVFPVCRTCGVAVELNLSSPSLNLTRSNTSVTIWISRTQCWIKYQNPPKRRSPARKEAVMLDPGPCHTCPLATGILFTPTGLHHTCKN